MIDPGVRSLNGQRGFGAAYFRQDGIEVEVWRDLVVERERAIVRGGERLAGVPHVVTQAIANDVPLRIQIDKLPHAGG